VVSTRAATAQECPAGGTVRVSTSQSQVYACAQGVLSTVGQPTTQTEQSPSCNPPATTPEASDGDAPLPDWAVGLLGLQLAGLLIVKRRQAR